MLQEAGNAVVAMLKVTANGSWEVEERSGRGCGGNGGGDAAQELAIGVQNTDTSCIVEREPIVQGYRIRDGNTQTLGLLALSTVHGVIRALDINGELLCCITTSISPTTPGYYTGMWRLTYSCQPPHPCLKGTSDKTQAQNSQQM
eukprot:1000976-Pelagomonas_calceolata.AAC.4